MRIGDPDVTKKELAAVVRERGGDEDLDGVSAEGLRDLLKRVRARFADAERLPTVENIDSDDDDKAVERARAERDIAARDAWKAGKR